MDFRAALEFGSADFHSFPIALSPANGCSSRKAGCAKPTTPRGLVAGLKA